MLRRNLVALASSSARSKERFFSAIVERTDPSRKGSLIPFTLGRFEPFHYGHESLIYSLVDNFPPVDSTLPRVIVAIGASNHDRDTKKNPFSFEQRAIMAQMAMPHLFSPDLINIDPKDNPAFLRFVETNPPSFEPLLHQTIEHCTRHGIPTNILEFFASVKPGDERTIVTPHKTYIDSHPLAGLARSLGCGFNICGMRVNDGTIINATSIRTSLVNNFHLLRPVVFQYIQEQLALAYINNREVGANQDSDKYNIDEAKEFLRTLEMENCILNMNGALPEIIDVPLERQEILASYRALAFKERFQFNDSKPSLSTAVGKKIAIIGMGKVGMSTLQQIIANRQISSEDTLVFCDIDDKAKDKIQDFYYMCMDAGVYPIVETVNTKDSAEFAKLVGANVVFMTCGKPVSRYKLSEDKNMALYENAEMIKSIAPQISKYAPEAVVILDVTPINVISRYFAHISGLPSSQIIGKSGDIDTEKMRGCIALAIFKNNKEFAKENGYTVPIILESLDKLGSNCCLIGTYEAAYTVPSINPEAIVLGKKLSELLTDKQMEEAVEESKKRIISSSSEESLASLSYGAASANSKILSKILGRESGEVFVATGTTGDLYGVPFNTKDKLPPNFLTTPARLGFKGVLSAREVPSAKKELMAQAAKAQDSYFKKLLEMDEIKKILADFISSGINFSLEKYHDIPTDSVFVALASDKTIAGSDLEKMAKLQSAFEKIFENDEVHIASDDNSISFHCFVGEVGKVEVVWDVVKKFLKEERRAVEHPISEISPREGGTKKLVKSDEVDVGDITISF